MFESVLVANRGEIARRVITTARRMGIRTVAVYSEADAELPYVREADQAVPIGPPPPARSYLDTGAILAAARKTLALLTAQPQAMQQVMATARQHIFAKGTDSHDYKFSSAVLEDFYHVTPAWRNRFLASSMFWLKGGGGADSPVLARTRAALGDG